MLYLAAAILSACYVHLAERRGESALICYIGPIALFCLLAGLRGHSVGVDVEVYGVNAFNSAISSTYWDYSQSFYGNQLGFGYALLTWIVSNVIRNEQIYFAVIQLVTVLPFMLSLSWIRSGRKWIGVYSYGLLIFPLSLCLMRQMVAVCLICLSYKYVRERHLLKWVAVGTVALSFHPSAAIGFLIVPVYFAIKHGCAQGGKRPSLICFSIILITVAMTGLIIVFHRELLSIAQMIKPSYTLDQLSYDTPGFFGAVLLLVLPAVLCIYIYIKHSDEKRECVDTLCLLTFVICGGTLMELSMVASGLSRIGYYGICFAPLSAAQRDKTVGRITSAIQLLSITAFFLLTIIIQRSGEVFPYVFI